MGPLAVPQLHSLDGALVECVPPELALYPFGVFTTFVVVDGSVLGRQDHLGRLKRDARALWGHALDERSVLEVLQAHVDLLTGPATVRITLWPEELPIATPSGARGCRILVSSRSVAFPFEPQFDFSVGTAEFQRDLPQVKSTSLLGPLRLRREAQMAGYDDVLFRRGDQVMEGATWAVVCWRAGEVATPGDAVLPSITAKHLGRIASQLGWIFRVRPVSMAELLDADLVQAASANHPARGISAVDGRLLARNESLLSQVAAGYAALPRSDVTGPTDAESIWADDD